MFVQVVRGKVKDGERLRSQAEAWEREVRPRAIGFLGSTGGITDDGDFIVLARFEDEESAKANSALPEQDRWWKATEQHLEDVTFHDCSDVEVWGGGGSDEAGFVQIMQGRVNDIDAVRRLNDSMEKEMPVRRPDVLGGLTIVYDDGAFTDVVYFSSVEEARRNEKAMSEDPPAEMEEWASLIEGDITYYDLEEPWLVSKATSAP